MRESLDDNDISTSDIDEYIRSAHEVSLLSHVAKRSSPTIDAWVALDFHSIHEFLLYS